MQAEDEQQPRSVSVRQSGKEFRYIVIGIIASIFLYISTWELLTTLVGKQSIPVQLRIWLLIMIGSLFVMWWLSRQSPSFLSAHVQI